MIVTLDLNKLSVELLIVDVNKKYTHIMNNNNNPSKEWKFCHVFYSIND